MIRGTQVYGDIDARIRAARAELDDVAKDLQRATAHLERLGVAESRDLGRLARVRLEALEAQRVIDGLDEADRQVLALLGQKHEEVERVRQAMAASETHQEDLDRKRLHHLARLDEARAVHAKAVADALARLETVESYQFQQERMDTVTAQAARADEKAAQAEHDRVAKGEPYEDDKLFAYLWKRRYGTSDYRANNLIRMLDGWVARLCKYDRARLDYAMLLEIPVRLREHADHLAHDAEAEVNALDALRDAAFEKAGIPRLAETVQAHEHALAESEAALDAEEANHRQFREARAALDAGEDAFTREAIAVLRAHLEHEPISTLQADASRTATPEDDGIVRSIAEQREFAKSLRAESRGLRDRQGKGMAALNDLEEVRRRYRRQNYDARDSTFQDDLDTGGLLDDLLGGAVVIGDVLGKMNRKHRFEVPRPKRRRSGGGFGFPDFGGSSSGRSSGGSRRRAPSSRPRSSGGFRTGGGF